jgi:H+/Cl- antiporter ClcA
VIPLHPNADLLPPPVDVHALWGLFLGLFALFRFLTYFFLYLRPPASILPSRPPTEALAALMLTCGGVVFILSTEQVTFAAMRHGFDDIMVSFKGDS